MARWTGGCAPTGSSKGMASRDLTESQPACRRFERYKQTNIGLEGRVCIANDTANQYQAMEEPA